MPSFSSLTLMELLNNSGRVVTFFRFRDRLRDRVRTFILAVVKLSGFRWLELLIRGALLNELVLASSEAAFCNIPASELEALMSGRPTLLLRLLPSKKSPRLGGLVSDSSGLAARFLMRRT